MTPTVFSSGFATVDVILEDPLLVAAGGTALNVALALNDLGWASSFGGTIGDDPAGAFLSDYLSDHSVDHAHLRREATWTTPIVLQENVRGDHVWKFSCPHCGALFAKHRPGPPARAEGIAGSVPAPDVYFFDRATLYGIRLAEIWAARGTTVVFEPAGIGRPALFARAAAAAHLIKFSSERAPAFAAELSHVPATLVETLGPQGARYRLPGEEFSPVMPAQHVDQLVDSAGAGDWTTAGLLARLASNGNVREQLGDGDAVADAVNAGQQLGGEACTWQGVRPESASVLPGSFEEFGCPVLVREHQVVSSASGPA